MENNIENEMKERLTIIGTFSGGEQDRIIKAVYELADIAGDIWEAFIKVINLIAESVKKVFAELSHIIEEFQSMDDELFDVTLNYFKAKSYKKIDNHNYFSRQINIPKNNINISLARSNC